VALHILGDDVGNLSGGRDGYTDQRAMRGLDLSRWDQLLAFINRRNDEWVRATRRISPRLLCELLTLTGRAFSEYVAQLDPDALGVPVSWAGPGPAPMWLHVAREYTERWLHQQHIRDAVAQPGLKERRWFAPVLDTFARALPHTLRAVTAPPGTCLRLVIVGEAGDTWRAVRVDDAWQLTEESIVSPDATAILDQETAWRLFTRGLRKDAAAQRARFEGETALARAVLDMVSIIA
jgi:hypothetical protein